MMFIILLIGCGRECNDVFVVKQKESAGTADYPILTCPDGEGPNDTEKHYVLFCTDGCDFNNDLHYCVNKNDLDDFVKNSCCNLSTSREEFIMHAELDCDGNIFKKSTFY